MSSRTLFLCRYILCNLDSLDIAKLDIDSDILDQDIDFTFNDFNVLEEFNKLS